MTEPRKLTPDALEHALWWMDGDASYGSFAFDAGLRVRAHIKALDAEIAELRARIAAVRKAVDLRRKNEAQ